MKNIIPVLAIIAVIGLFLGVIQPASAVTSEIDLIDADVNPLPSEINVYNGQFVHLGAYLKVDGDIKHWRWIHLYVYDPWGRQIVNVKSLTGLGWGGDIDYAVFEFNTRGSPGEDYRMHFIYWGSDDWPRADKEVIVHIVD